MNSYRLKITTISPVHIGTGEMYEPTNFVIDNGYLYEFNEVEFYKKLTPKMQKKFIEAVESKNNEALFNIHKLIKENKKIAIDSAKLKVQVTKGIERDYNTKIGRVVQREKKGSNKVFNRFQIERTLRLTNQNRVYIPGSSIKGAIATAYREEIFKRDIKLEKELFDNRYPQENIFKNLLIADTTPINTYSIIGFGLNKERFEDDDSGPSKKIEVIFSGSEFETKLKIKDYIVKEQIDFELIKKSCNNHYLPLFLQIFKPKTIFRGKKVDDYTNEYLSESFYKKYKEFTLKDNQFILRVGKHSGARAVTINGNRKIKVKVSGGGPNRKPTKFETLDQETTTWFLGASEGSISTLLPFGWILCEVI